MKTGIAPDIFGRNVIGRMLDYEAQHAFDPLEGGAVRWREYLESDAEVLACFAKGDPALTKKGDIHYLACWPDEELLASLMRNLSQEAGLELLELPDHIRIRRRGELTFAFNYGTEDWNVPSGVELVLGERSLKPQDVAIWR